MNIHAISKIIKQIKIKSLIFITLEVLIAIGVLGFYFYQTRNLAQKISQIDSEKANLQAKHTQTTAELEQLKKEDQYVINQQLKEEINNIQKTYKDAVAEYESFLELTQGKPDEKLQQLFAQSLTYLSQRNYASASSTLALMEKQIESQKTKIASEFKIPANVPVVNSAPASGYSRQQVKTDRGTYLVDIISADLVSTRVIVDTASEGDCSNECPVMPLGNYVSRSGAFAGINGTFFCPPEYPSCAGKTNSFDTLLMNKNKFYFNSENNKYSTVPLVYFSGTSMGVRSQSLEWGRDTSMDAVIANHPLYVSGGSNRFGGSSDPKISSKGARTFIGNKGSTVYIGIVHNASAEDAAAVLVTMGLENALGLDQGGSTALMFNGRYLAGPGRNIPNAVLFVRK